MGTKKAGRLKDKITNETARRKEKKEKKMVCKIARKQKRRGRSWAQK